MRARHLHLVHTPDRGRDHADALRGAWLDGQAMGRCVGYGQGWRYGVVCGAVACGLGAALCVLWLVSTGLLRWAATT